jgi:DnaA family protein
MKQIPLAIGPEPARTFENFLPGANGGALAHLLALAPGAPPVYLWGPEGSGKTHLLHAVVERAAVHGRRAAWFSAATPAPWGSAAEREWLVIDDAHALDPVQQQAAFSLFVEAADRGAGIVAAGALPPVDLPVREDLRTRLGWGHVFASSPRRSEVRARSAAKTDRRAPSCPTR